MNKVIGAAIGVLCSSSLAMAQDTRGAELAFGDRRLNATYENLIRQLTPADEAALRSAQRAWLKFRDADCAFGWPDHRDCLIRRTEEREKQLRNSIYFDGSGKLIKLPAPR